ncbi:rab GTPase-activating protein 1-like isoform X2 [Folsomia candida]|uniref:rab GTPase-activating protein 1-like isoform X2 n=1 Tax=Folsomia candida TaxID=158441 RepID=UPI000B8FBA63|nr:rab GTPase-activating protein 1-like isoform X2 [Folsomia candida]
MDGAATTRTGDDEKDDCHTVPINDTRKVLQVDADLKLPIQDKELLVELSGNSQPVLQANNQQVIPVREEEDFIIFHGVSYLGASKIHEANNELEIQKIISFLNEASDSCIQVSVAVPFYSDGEVVVYEEEDQSEISRFKINQIIFFARGDNSNSDSSCFAFTCSHGKTLNEAIFQCHAFRSDVKDAVGRVYQSFSNAFSGPKRVAENLVTTMSAVSDDTPTTGSHECSIFEVSLEMKEDDGKGNFHLVPRSSYFKLKSFVSKQIVLTIQQISHSSPEQELIVERCFGILFCCGRFLRPSDLQLCEMLSYSRGVDKKSYVVTGQWDCNDPAFQPLNQETPKESCIFFSVAVDIVLKNVQEPVRFTIESKARVYPPTEKFWVLSRKHHVTQQFQLTLERVQDSTKLVYKVKNCTAMGEVEKSKLNLNLNFTSFIRSSSIGSIELETPTSKDEEDSDDDDEALPSGQIFGSTEISDEQIAVWSDILKIWPVDSPRPKQVEIHVRSGIPDTMRGNMWMRLANCDEMEMLELYKTLISKECSSDDVIRRDIHRTFPANEFFQSGNGQELLFKICHAYAIYDVDVGYLQGISFITAALLLQMPEEQAFCLLVKIMFGHINLRNLYLNEFDNLHQHLYQLEKLIQDQIPELSVHFRESGIEPHMFASQWFLTLFCGKFPLDFVFRVIDIILLDGFNTVFQIAIALLMAARRDLLTLDFEGILRYFRVILPKKYRSADATNLLIQSVYSVKVKKSKLKRYKREFDTMKEHARNSVDSISRLSTENKLQKEDIMRFEYLVTNLVLSKTSTDERCFHLEQELHKIKLDLKEKEEINLKLEEETNSVKDLFQRELKRSEDDICKKDSIISEYKQICSKLSSQIATEQKLSRERMLFFQTNLCPPCFQFASCAINIASSGKTNGDSTESGAGDRPLEDIVKPLENELAKTKIALAASECDNDDTKHKLSLALAELETYRNSGAASTWLWKNLSNKK